MLWIFVLHLLADVCDNESIFFHIVFTNVKTQKLKVSFH